MYSTMCSVVEVEKSKPKKQTNKQLLKVWFAYYLTLYWDFWYWSALAKAPTSASAGAKEASIGPSVAVQAVHCSRETQ